MSGIVVIGAGAAGLAAALRLAPHPVTVLTRAPLGSGAASAWAQGGIAAAIGPDDAPSLHAADTLAVAGGIGSGDMAANVAGAAPAVIDWLIRLGAKLDRDDDGNPILGREAAHSRRRIVHAAGDGTGKEVMRTLVAATQRAAHVTVREGSAERLLVDDGRIAGVLLRAPGGERQVLPASAVILATGGIGQLYRHTTNPKEACGDGIALAAAAGADLADLEFVQFHPTALAVGLDPMPLCTEALRGEGATLIDERGLRFMTAVHRDAELAPRDVVARAIWRQRRGGRRTYLDCRATIGASFAERFPMVHAYCAAAGIDPARRPIPVAPAQHYHMGGVATDARGRSTVDGLWALGEVACTGLHGANRLASNSLLEAIAMAPLVSEDVLARAPAAAPALRNPPPSRQTGPENALDVARLREVMDAGVGLVRDEASLTGALSEILALERRHQSASPAIQGRIMVAKLITVAALLRNESRGSHFRSDHPEAVPSWRRRHVLTLELVNGFVAGIDPARSSKRGAEA
ncbi:MAG TPA: L-aspartate oxidase [Candidatus Cybelea sp.]|nr:L-aspartate oxidase [Candidatus Cybelea sp.]